ncbi:MAG: cytochrome c oxidase subunit II [Anaerolineales bacterium]|nr:cytochrome c oxidase subunit II [Anaerolineales bacterium]MCA9929663.1 cytochrome c oxidase subunit II [Anaerolineales bacterium]
MNRTKHMVLAGVLIVVATVLLRVAFGYMFQLPFVATAEETSGIAYYLGSWPAPANSAAAPIDGMFNSHFWMISFLFALIIVLMLYSAVAFRRRPGDTEDAPHIHSNTALEIGWTVVPVVVVLGFGVYGAIVLNEITTPQSNEMTIKVSAQQWAWSFEYPEQEGVKSAELVLPVNQPIRLEMEAVDVLHSFWVPEFRVKQDLVPGRTTELRITPAQMGDYKLRCAEICGTDHALMLANVRVVDEATFAQFIEESKFRFSDLTPEERGQLWWSNSFYGCEACHSIDGSAGVGPSWQGVYGRQETLDDGTTITVDDAYIRSSILDPGSQIVAGFANAMPANFGDRLTAQQADILAKEGVEIDIIDDLIAFMKTLEE